MITLNNEYLNVKLQNSIFTNFQTFSKTLNRLMTGLKVGSPSDGPAAFYVASKFSTQISGLQTANTNIQHALDLLGIADDSIDEINEIMGKIRDLVQKSTNEYLTPTEREANQKTINKLFASAQQIKNNTTYNGIKLFEGATELDGSKTYYNNEENDTPPIPVYVPEQGNTSSQPPPAPPGPGGVAPENIGKIGTLEFSSNESKYVQIGDKVYTIENRKGYYNTLEYYTDRNGQLTFGQNGGYSQNFKVTAVDGQADNIIWNISYGELNTGDGDDSVVVNSYSNTINTGDGNDSVVVNDYDNTINTGDGNDSVTDNYVGSYNSNKFQNIETYTDQNGVCHTITESNTVNFTANQTQTLNIGGKTYTAQNIDGYGQDLNYMLDNNGQIIFNGYNFKITANNGQDDNIIWNISYGELNTGDGDDSVVVNSYSNTINTGDGDDSVVGNGNYNTINTGDGNDSVTDNYVGSYNSNKFQNIETYTDQNGVCHTITESNTVHFTANQTQTLNIGGKTYTAQNIDGYGQDLNYMIDSNGQIIFNGSGFKVTAADSQDDNIIWNIARGELNTGDGDDNVVVNNSSNTINTGDGDDTVVVNSYSNTINTGDGDDSVVGNGNYNTINTGDGNDSVTDNYVGSYNSNKFQNMETYTDQNGVCHTITESNTVHFTANQTQTLNIGGKTYTVQNTIGYGHDLDYILDSNGQIIFNGSGFKVTAADGQADDIIWNVSHGELNTGDGADNVVVNDASNTINTGDGDDNVVVNDAYNTINTGDGDDNVVVNDAYNTINLGNGNDEISLAKDTGNHITLSNGASAKVEYGDKTYTVTNLNGSANTFMFSANSTMGATYEEDQLCIGGHHISVTAADGQNDNIIWGVNDGELNTGDGDDVVIISTVGYNNIINLGDGNDYIYVNGEHSTVYTGNGNDWVEFGMANMSSSYIYSDGNDTIDNLPDNFAVGAHCNPYETKTTSINGKVYTIKNNTSETNSLQYFVEAGKINIDANNYTITAKDGQDDDLIINGSHNTINLGDGANNISFGWHSSNNLVTKTSDSSTTMTDNSSSQTNILQEIENSTQDGYTSVKLNANESRTITIDGKQYDLYNSTAQRQTLTYKVSNGEITFGGADIEITAHSGQEDNIIVAGTHLNVNTGDMNDKVKISGKYNNVNAGNGDDEVTIFGNYNTVNGDNGNDKVANIGRDNIYRGMEQLGSQAQNMSVNVDSNISPESQYKLSTTLNMPDIEFDVSSRESSLEALNVVDNIMKELTKSKANISFQENMLESIMKTNLTRLTNLKDARSTLIDADTATEYNNLLSMAENIQNIQLLQSQMIGNHASVLMSLVNSLSA